MRTPRSNRRFDRKLPTRWTRLPDLSTLRVSRRKKFFAVVSPPIRIDASRQPIRRVLIFDNHPATLQLLHDADLAERRKTMWQIAMGVALAAIVVVGIFLSLL
jgi:hypothetical protein